MKLDPPIPFTLDDFMGGLLAGFVVGIAAGVFGGFFIVADTQHDFDTKDSLRAECLHGNDRACAVYEVDYGR